MWIVKTETENHIWANERHDDFRDAVRAHLKTEPEFYWVEGDPINPHMANTEEGEPSWHVDGEQLVLTREGNEVTRIPMERVED